MNRRFHLAAALVAALAGCKDQEVELPTGLRGEARSNPMLAAERMLDHFGIAMDTQYGLASLPGDGAVLLTEHGQLRVRGPILDRFLDWVDAGGEAIVCLDGFDMDTSFLGQMEIEFDEGGLFDPEDDSDWLYEQSALLDALDVERAESFNESYETIDVLGFESAMRSSEGQLEHLGMYETAFRIGRGAGRVTVLPTGRIFNNQTLGDHENARLLYQLVAGEDGVAETAPVSRVTLAYVTSPGVWSLLVARAPWALWGGALLLLLWLWHSALRFGPVEKLDVTAQAGFRNHVDALGRFLWRHDRGQTLLANARKTTLQRLDMRMPDLHGKDRAVFCELLAERTSFDPHELDRALFLEENLKPASFVTVLQSLTRLRAEI